MFWLLAAAVAVFYRGIVIFESIAG